MRVFPSLSPTVGAITFLLAVAARGEGPEPALSIGGVTSEGLVIATTGVSLTRTVPIINTGKEAVDLSVDVSPLLGPDAATTAAKWDLDGQTGRPLSAKVVGLGSAQLTMTAELPVVGTYQGTISLIYGEKRHPYAVKVTRAAAQPGVAVTGLAAVAFAGSEPRVVRFTLKESVGGSLKLNPPRLLSLTRKVGGKDLQAPISGVTFLATPAHGKEAPVGDSLTIERHGSIPVVMRVAGATEPGEYTGSLHLASAAGALAEVPFTFYVRRPWWLCGALIAIGVALSHFLRRYVKRDRPRLILTRRLVRLDADIDAVIAGFPDPEDKDLLDALKRRIQRLASDLDVDQSADAEATLKDIDGKLSLVPLWSTLRRRIAATIPPDLAEPVRPVLDDTRRFLVAPSNDAETRIGAQRDAIRQALATIDTALRERLTADVTRTREQAQAAAADLSPHRKAAFQRDVLDTLAAVESAIKRSPPDDQAARRGIDEAGRAYARLVARELEERLASVTRPDAVSEAEWSALVLAFHDDVRRVHDAPTGSVAVAAYEDAYGSYLAVLLRVAGGRLEALRVSVPAADTEAHARLKNAGEALDQARTRIRQRDLDAARTSYEAAKAEIDAVPPPVVATRTKDGQAVATADAFPAVSAAASYVGLGLSEPLALDAPRERQARGWSPLSKIDTALRSRDRLVSLVTVGVAILFGLYLIWMDNLTWGTGKDMAAAVFWGLGLHQVAGNTLFAKLDLELFEGHLTGAKVDKVGGGP